MSNVPTVSAMHILLADDNDANCLVARTILERGGHFVVRARNGDEALTRTKIASFDLIILDILMPVMNGLSALQRIRQDRSRNQNTPIFALAAYCDAEDRQRYASAGFDAVLSKPLRPGDLEDAVLRIKDLSKSNLNESVETLSADRTPVLNEGFIIQLTRYSHPNELQGLQFRVWTSIQRQCERIAIVLPGALEGDTDKLSEFRLAIHTIKGASTSVGLARVTHISQRLRNAPPTQISGLMRLLIDALSEGRPALKQALSRTRQLNSAVQMGREDQSEPSHHSQNDGSAIRN